MGSGRAATRRAATRRAATRRARPRRLGLLLAAGWVTAAACVDFDRVDRNVCGNDIVEPIRLEDCDGASVAEGGREYACGAPGTPAQCRLLCTDDGKQPCPSGWACNPDDGICRQPRLNTFALADTPRRVGLTRVATADLDGDGRQDLVTLADDRDEGTSQLMAHFFDRDGAVEGEVRQPTALNRSMPLVVGPLGSSASPSPAILASFEDSTGIASFRGRERGFLPGAIAEFTGYGTDFVFGPVVLQNETTLGYRSAFGTALTTLLNGGNLNSVAPFILDAPFMTRIVPGLSGALPNDTFGVGFVHDTFFPTQAMAMTVPGEGFARVYDPFPAEADPWTYVEVELPAGVTIPEGGGAWLTDFDGDGLDDLLASGGEDTYIAFGVSTFDPFDRKHFTSRPGGEPDNRFAPLPAIIGVHPLAVGQLDGDPFGDMVLPEGFGIALTSPDDVFSFGTFTTCPQQSNAFPVTHRCSLHSLGEGVSPASNPEWTRARIADVNADAAPDIVAATDAGREIDIMLRDDTLYIRRRIETPARVETLETGDVSADLVDDVLFSVPSDEGSSIYVSEGRVDGGPAPPRLLLEVPELVSLQAKGDLLIAWKLDDQVHVTFTNAQVSGANLLAPSIIPCLSETGIVDAKQQVAMGRFDDRPGVDALMLYRDCFRPTGAEVIDQLVLYPSGPNASLAAVLDEPVIGGACQDAESYVGCEQAFDAFHPTAVELSVGPSWSTDGLIVPIDLVPDGEDRDELVIIAPSGEEASEMATFRLDPEPAGLPRFELVRRQPLPVRIGGSYEAGWRGKAITVDADDDGDLDILVLTSGPEPQLVLLTNEEGVISTSPEPLVFATAPQGTPRSFALLDADYDQRQDDLAIAAGGVVHLALDAFSGTAVAERVVVPGLLDTQDDVVEDLLAADFNGDGLTDIGVFIGSSVRILQSVPDNP